MSDFRLAAVVVLSIGIIGCLYCFVRGLRIQPVSYKDNLAVCLERRSERMAWRQRGILFAVGAFAVGKFLLLFA